MAGCEPDDLLRRLCPILLRLCLLFFLSRSGAGAGGKRRTATATAKHESRPQPSVVVGSRPSWALPRAATAQGRRGVAVETEKLLNREWDCAPGSHGSLSLPPPQPNPMQGPRRVEMPTAWREVGGGGPEGRRGAKRRKRRKPPRFASRHDPVYRTAAAARGTSLPLSFSRLDSSQPTLFFFDLTFPFLSFDVRTAKERHSLCRTLWTNELPGRLVRPFGVEGAFDNATTMDDAMDGRRRHGRRRYHRSPRNPLPLPTIGCRRVERSICDRDSPARPVLAWRKDFGNSGEGGDKGGGGDKSWKGGKEDAAKKDGGGGATAANARKYLCPDKPDESSRVLLLSGPPG
ncbi:hypothetical protein ACHAWF_012265, partial [Thalassiosira exigua]